MDGTMFNKNMEYNLKNENKEVLESALPEYTKRAYEFENIVKDDDC